MAIATLTPADIPALVALGDRVEAGDLSYRCSEATTPPDAADLTDMLARLTGVGERRAGGFDAYAFHTATGHIGWLVFDPSRLTALGSLLTAVFTATGSCWGEVANPVNRARIVALGWIELPGHRLVHPTSTVPPQLQQEAA